jgi:peptide/nickel transport system permease protein
MITFIARRLVLSLISVLGASFVIFVISRLSGDPVTLMLPPSAPEDLVVSTRAELGLDKPLFHQYWIFLNRALHGDFGNSYHWEVPALQVVLDRLPATIELALAGLCFAIVVAVPLGVLSAVHRGGWIDYVARLFAMLGQAMPSFWLGLLLIVVFAVELGWLPAFGYGGISHLIMPAVALGWYPVAAMTRMLRSSMLDVLDSDYILVERSLGISSQTVIWKYALRNAAVPLITIIGVYFATMLSGAFIVEVVFAWPGLGRAVVDAVLSRDFPVVQAGVLVIATLFVASNLVVDLSYGIIDPRIRNVR